MIALKIIAGLAIIIVSSIFWRLGGADNHSKLWRRIGVPIATTLYGFSCGLWWQAPVAGLAIWLISILPITLIGSEVIPKNIAWIVCLGTFYGAVPFIFSVPSSMIMGVILGGVYTLLYSFFVLGSELYRLKSGKDIWWLQEYLSGGILGALIVGGIYLS